jgi:hypothetical protein
MRQKFFYRSKNNGDMDEETGLVGWLFITILVFKSLIERGLLSLPYAFIF